MNSNPATAKSDTRLTNVRVLILYVVSFLLILTGATGATDPKSHSWLRNGVILIGVAGFAAGFLVRHRKIFMAIWASWFGKLMAVCYSALAAVVAILPAKHILANAIPLPPGDFSVTLSLLTVMCTPGVWLAGVAIFIFLSYVLFTLTVFAAFISLHEPFDSIIRTAAERMPSYWAWPRSIADERGWFFAMAFCDSLAAALVAALLAYGVIASYEVMNRPNLVRLFAYYADYDNATGFPGVQKRPFHLHENGVVSYAHMESMNVEIEVARVKD